MAKVQHILTRGNTQYMRIRVPKDLRGIYKKDEVVRSLKTGDMKEARKRVTLEKALLEAEFEKKRRQQAALSSEKDVLSSLSNHALVGLVGKWVTSIKATEEENRLNSTSVWTEEDKHDHFIELRQEEFAAREELRGSSSNERHDGMTTASQFLRDEGIPFNRKSESFRRLGSLFTNAIHDLAQQRLAEWTGKSHASGIIGFAGFEPEKKVHLGALIEEYMSNPRVARSTSTQNNYRIIFRALDEMLGKETFVHTITREQCKKISNLIGELPARPSQRVPGKTLAEAVAVRKQKGWPKLAAATFNMNMHKLRALMQYAVEEGYLKSNPAERLTIKETKKKKDLRNPFTEEQLKKIFSAPLYTGCVDGQSGYNKPGAQKPRNPRFWLPVIALWTGMRMNEIGQLQTTDIQVEKGITVIRVTELPDDEEGNASMAKTVKTSSSIRTVPVHPMLERIGFLEYVAKMKTEGQDRLFPEIGMDKRGYYTKGMSQWFSRFLINIGAKTKRTSFHSFRHSYRDAMRAAELPFEIGLDLGGWQRSTPESGYGDGYKADQLHKHLCKISYDLDLSHLYIQ